MMILMRQTQLVLMLSKFTERKLNSSVLSFRILDDCFDDLEEPLYGYVVEVETISNETCNINQESENPCRFFDDDFDEKDLNYRMTDNFVERQGNTGLSAGGRSCRFSRG